MLGTKTDYTQRHSYGVNANKAGQLLKAGLVGTVAMVVLGYILRAIGLPGPDFGDVYGSVIAGLDGVLVYSGAWWAGLAWHAITGIVVFPFVMDFLADKKILPQRRWLKGISFGVAIWFLMQAIIRPAAGHGFFSSELVNPILSAFCSLICWSVYGAVVDSMERVRMMTVESGITHRRAA